jgi:hypothetical protein
MQTIPGTNDNRSLQALLHPRLLTQVEMKLVAGGDSPDAGTNLTLSHFNTWFV